MCQSENSTSRVANFDITSLKRTENVYSDDRRNEEVLLRTFPHANKETLKLYYCDLFYV